MDYFQKENDKIVLSGSIALLMKYLEQFDDKV
jgi:hypothetical protein